MAGLVRFSEAMSYSVSDCRLYSFRIRLATSGSSRSRARKVIVVMGAATIESYWLSGAGWRRAQEVRRRDCSFAQNVRLRTCQVEDARGHPARSGAAVEDRRHPGQRGSLAGIHRRLLAVKVRARGHERPSGAEQPEGDLVPGDAHAQRATALGAAVDVHPALELWLRGRHQDQRQPDWPPLDGEDPPAGDLVVGCRAEPVDGVGRKRDNSTAAQQVRGPGEPGAGRFQEMGSPRTHAEGSEFVGMEDHASTTRSWPPRSRWVSWLSNARRAASVILEAISGLTSTSNLPPGLRRAGAASSRRSTMAAPSWAA